MQISNNKKYNYITNEAITGIFGIITDNNTLTISDSSYTANIGANNLIADNSTVNISYNTNINKAKFVVVNNSIINNNVQEYDYKKISTFNNSFVNIPTLSITNSLSTQYGGSIYNNLQNADFSWSSHLMLDNIIKWATKNNNSFYTKKDNIINGLKIENNKFTDDFNIFNQLFYNHQLIYGRNKNVKFYLKNQNIFENNITLSGFTIQNNSNNYFLINETFKQLTINQPIVINNINYFEISNVNITSLDINDSQLVYNGFPITTIKSYNSDLTINYELTDFTDIQNTNINTSAQKLTYKVKINNDTYSGYGLLIDQNAEPISAYLTYDHHPQKGNVIRSAETIKINNRNNRYKYGLESHTHKRFKNDKGLFDVGTIFPENTFLKHEKITNQNYNKKLYRQGDSCTYCPLDTSFINMLMPARTVIPVGTIVEYYQVLINGKFLPNVPYGFYALDETKEINIPVDVDDPTSVTFNGLLAKLLGYTNNNIKLPKGKIHSWTVGTNEYRLIQIIKYSDKLQSRD